MLLFQIITVLALAASLFSIWLHKTKDEEEEAMWASIYYLMAFLQEEYKDFGKRKVKLESTEENE